MARSAAELGIPDLRALTRDGDPTYVWAEEDRVYWALPREPVLVRALRVATPLRR